MGDDKQGLAVSDRREDDDRHVAYMGRIALVGHCRCMGHGSGQLGHGAGPVQKEEMDRRVEVGRSQGEENGPAQRAEQAGAEGRGRE